jgi:hypothetical protein
VKSAWAAPLLLALAGCAPPAALWLQVEAPLTVPAQCDGLAVEVTRAADGSPLFDQTYQLSGAQQFPLTLTLKEERPERVDNGPMTVRVQALKEGLLAAPWAEGAGVVSLEPDVLVPLVIRLCDCAG